MTSLAGIQTIGDLCQKWAHVLVTAKTLGMRGGFKRSVQIIDRWKCHALPPGTCLIVRSYGFQMRRIEQQHLSLLLFNFQGLCQMQLLSLLLACTT
jgi:hypothetical protein